MKHVVQPWWLGSFSRLCVPLVNGGSNPPWGMVPANIIFRRKADNKKLSTLSHWHAICFIMGSMAFQIPARENQSIKKSIWLKYHLMTKGYIVIPP